MTAESIDLARAEFSRGQEAFERGRYRESIEYLEKAVEIARSSTALGGEIQTWLVNAYSAVGRQEEAIALCEALTRHPDLEVRKQAKNVLYILQAPSLKKREDWNTKIPDLATIADEGNKNLGTYARPSTPTAVPPKRRWGEEETVDLSQVNTRDNAFLWVALAAIALLLASFAWLS